ncbi:hypothetical protein C0081_07085 [Cohaesibacter celericrescens]|uniref:Uncharacterized protein n=1 Tax=Cohaesibacter celericrescens TaxID=2067669 RepID=A0A2N5XTQ6_9HYPH|nr:hypothetical protein C0081_07085 [Cohaesibacter celericrescens]
MFPLIDYQQETPVIVRGPACFERPLSENFCFPLVLPASSGQRQKDQAEREPSPKAPPTPPYRGMASHTDHDFDLDEFENVAFSGAIGRGSGESDKLKTGKGVRG